MGLKQTLTYILTFILFIFANTNCIAQNENKTINLPFFDEIYVDGNIDIHIKQADKQKVSIAADNILFVDSISCSVSQAMLDIKNKSLQRVTVYITADSLHRISVSNNVRLYVERFNSSLLTINVSNFSKANLGVLANKFSLAAMGNSSVVLAVNAKSIETRLSTGAEMVISGNADVFLSISNANSKMKAFELTYRKARIMASEGAQVWIRSGNMEKLINGAELILDDKIK